MTDKFDINNKDQTGKTFLNEDPALFSYRTFKGYCFAQENGWTDVFPVGAVNMTFEDCNLCNVSLLGSEFPNTTIIGGAWFEHHAQNDGGDWVGSEEDPQEPMDKKGYEKVGISTDPKHIPKTKMDTPIKREVREQLEAV